MATMTPPVVITAPEPRGLRYGLLTAANGPLDLPTPHGLAGGVRYEPVSCGRARRYPAECDPLVYGLVPEKVFDGADPLITAEPVTVYATYQCGTAGHTAEAMEQKVRRRLANGEQTEAEAHLGDLLVAGATGLVGPDPASLPAVIGALQQWLYGVGSGQQAYGNVGYLHMPPRFEPYMRTDYLMEKDGPVWRTSMGTVVVFGGGYPDIDTIWITGQVTVWRAPEVFVPDVNQTLDRELNQWMAVAEREYAVAFDCVAASIGFTPPVASGFGAEGVASPQTLFTSQSRTATPAPALVNTGDALGFHLVIDVTSVTATPSVVPRVDGFDSVSGEWYNLITGAGITTTGITVLKVYPGITAIANTAASDVIPETIRVTMTHADADPITYTAAIHFMGG